MLDLCARRCLSPSQISCTKSSYVRLLSNTICHLLVNHHQKFQVNQAKQIVCCNEDGYVIGDSILFHHGENHVSIVGRPPVSNWVAFHAKTSGYDVEAMLDERSVTNPNQRANYRLQIQGPSAAAIFTELNGGTMPEIKVFHIGAIKIGNYSAMALNHSMSR